MFEPKEFGLVKTVLNSLLANLRTPRDWSTSKQIIISFAEWIATSAIFGLVTLIVNLYHPLPYSDYSLNQPYHLLAAELCGAEVSPMELRVGGKFRLGRKIGSGSFGDIYIGTNVTRHRREFDHRIIQIHHIDGFDLYIYVIYYDYH